MKRLCDAVRDGDVIRAVIRGTGANHDGKTTSITMPSEEAQADLIRETYRSANIPLDQTCYFEAHGTGTPQGVSLPSPSSASYYLIPPPAPVVEVTLADST